MAPPRRGNRKGKEPASQPEVPSSDASGGAEGEVLQDVFRAIGELTRLVHTHIEETHHTTPVQPPQVVPPAERPGGTLEQFRKMGATPFLGTELPLQADAWIQKLEKIFDVIRCTDQDRVAFAVFMLEGEADHWWKMKVPSLIQEGQVVTWQRFSEAFYSKYFTDTFRDRKEVEFLELKQGSVSVLEYERRFAQLSRFAPHVVADEVSKTKKFERGLKLSIRSAVAPLKIRNFADLVDRAEIIEQEEVDRQKAKDKRLGVSSEGVQKTREASQGTGRRKHWSLRESQVTGQDSSSRGPASPCDICGRFHPGRQCWIATGACFRCGQQGHRVRDCPFPPREASRQETLSVESPRESQRSRGQQNRPISRPLQAGHLESSGQTGRTQPGRLPGTDSQAGSAQQTVGDRRTSGATGRVFAMVRQEDRASLASRAAVTGITWFRHRALYYNNVLKSLVRLLFRFCVLFVLFD